MRINKHISETGVCSRREADAWIAAGRVAVNGVQATLGTRVMAGDIVTIDRRPLGERRRRIYIAFNKPVGITSTTERDVRGNIVDYIGHPERIFPIGRLDKDSAGLILLTNDGDIVNEVLRVENGHEKEYVVTVDRPITDRFLTSMSRGVPILGTVTRPCRTLRTGPRTFRIVLTQGLNRQIRRMCAAFGYEVMRLERVRIVNVKLGSLPRGRWRYLESRELKGLLPARFDTARAPASKRRAARTPRPRINP
jgi:23S rRNA pseudouridine2604 synthase